MRVRRKSSYRKKVRVMARSMNPSEVRVRSGKLASWWRHWRERGVISDPGSCRDADAGEHLARVDEAECREPHVLAGKWPAHPISWTIKSTVDRM
jgi:hypothetical protein